MNILTRYTHWLHGRWPAGLVEKLPEVREGGRTNISGVHIVGDLSGIPLLKLSSDTGAKAVDALKEEGSFQNRTPVDDVVDVLIIGGGVSGMAAAMRCSEHGLSYRLLEASKPFSTIENFPKAKPIYTYPTELTPAGNLQFNDASDVKETLLEDLHRLKAEHEIETVQERAERIERKGDLLLVHLGSGETMSAHRVIVAIGRSGNYRKLGVPGEDLDKVTNRLHDPAAYAGKNVLVVGGGDSALETAIATAEAGAQVSLSYRKPEFSRPKPDNIEKLDALQQAGSLTLYMASNVNEVSESQVNLTSFEGEAVSLDNDVVFTMIGREAPLDFFRRSKINISGEWRAAQWIGLILFMAFCTWMYHWKGVGFTAKWVNPNEWVGGLQGAWENPAHLFGVLRNAYTQPWVYYTTAYAICVTVFGVRRIKRRNTPYVTRQTITLMLIQIFPLFLLPCIFLPWAYHNGWFSGPVGHWIMGEFFPGGPGDFWRAFGLILAWPLMAWNVFTKDPMIGWLVISFIQTFVIIPLIVRRWGKGAYCGWICSCGALAETMGDAHRHKMPHGPKWNRVNMIGQAVLLFAFVILFVRIIGWVIPSTGINHLYEQLAYKMPIFNFKYFVDLWLAGILGVGFYFHFSGRVWCRFACPLAALMHIYARFSQFRILADKKKCISCNVCTSVCHQGIDIMNFANKGRPMEDPECVRCSACVQSCPTGVLSFGRIDTATGDVLGVDKLPASPVQMREVK